MSRKTRFKHQKTRKHGYEEYTNNNIIEFSKINSKKTSVELLPRTEAQEELILSLEDPEKDIVIVYGPAGTGKTYIATLWALKKFREGKYSKIVISRPNVATDGKDIGYLPGNMFSKMQPWVLPILDIFREYYRKDQIEQLIEGDIIEIVPLAYVRGRTFKNAVVIIDEAQNLTPNSMKSYLTRLGEGSKMIVAGDIEQSDHNERSGLLDFISRAEKMNLERIAIVKFDDKDVQRSKAVKEVLKIYKTDH